MSAPSAVKSPPPASYWGIVWGQFKKQTSSYVALWLIGVLFAIAVFAPAMANRIPFIWVDDSGVSFPWFHSLLFNRNVFSNGIDLFFNLLLVLSPLVLGSLVAVKTWVARKDIEPRRAFAAQLRWAGGWLLFIVAAYLVLLSIDPRTAVPNYRALSASPEIFSVFPPLRVHFDDTLHGLSGPGLHHLLGLDDAGRDIFVRLVYGTRVSLSIGVIAVGIYVFIGVILGSLAGFFGGRVDATILRLIEIFLCFPSFFLILTFIGFLDRPSIFWVMIIIGLIGWTQPARLIRGEFLRLRNIDFVAAAKACGLSNQRIIFRHVLPNAVAPVLVNATFGVASAVLIESSLAFLGLGDPTVPSWGRILAYGRETGSLNMMLIAGCAIFVTVSVFNLAGEGIRDALDPKLRK